MFSGADASTTSRRRYGSPLAPRVDSALARFDTATSTRARSALRAVAAAFKEAGYDYVEDQNGEYRDGYFPITISNLDDRRVSAAIGYLDPETRRRPNLTISAETQVAELLFEGTRCVGIKALVQGKETEFRVDPSRGEVIVSSGAIHSPAHLLRAGIGPAPALKELGIEIRAHLPGVGQRLMDHPSVSVSSPPLSSPPQAGESARQIKREVAKREKSIGGLRPVRT